MALAAALQTTYLGPMALPHPVRTLWCIVACALTGAWFAAAPAAAQAPDGVIEIWLESPPSLVAGIDLRLAQGGTDITDASCGPIAPVPDTWFVERRCAGLADGTYAVAQTGAPADAIVTWECVDIVAARIDHTAVPLGNGFTQWRCVATVSPPGVVIDGTTVAGGDGLDIVIEDAAGDPIGPCEVDRRGQIDRRWCGPLADGAYTAVPQNVPAGLRAVSACADVPNTLGSVPGVFTIDATTPRWRCEQPVAFAPLAVQLDWSGAGGHDRAWFVAAEPTLRDVDGAAVAGVCTMRQRVDDGGDFVFVGYSCVGVAPGTYAVTFEGIPADFDVDSNCGSVVVPVQPGFGPEQCSVSVASASLVSPDDPVGPDPADPGPADPDPPVLPSTGTATSVLLLAGFAALASGTALLQAGRRRAPFGWRVDRRM